MINKLKQEYKKRRYEYYKNYIIELSKKTESKRFPIGKIIDKEMFMESLDKFSLANNLEDILPDIAKAVYSYWDSENIGESKKGKSKKIKNLYSLAFSLNVIPFAQDYRDELYDLNLLRNLISFLEGTKDIVFIDFGDLEELMETLPLNKNEKADLMIEIIKKDEQLFKSGNYDIPVNTEAILDATKNPLIVFIIEELVKFNAIDFYEILNVPFYKKVKKAVDKVKENNPIDVSFIETKCLIIVSLLDKGNIFDDIVKEQLLSCLDYLGCSYVYKYLVAKEIKASKKESTPLQQQRITKTERNQTPQVDLMPRKEINSILRSVKEVYDFENDICLKLLSMDEIIYYVSCLIKINADESVIERFIRTSEKLLRQNPIGAYFQMLDKMQSVLSKDYEVNYMDEVENLINELYKNSSNEEKCVEIIEEIDNYIKLINNSFGNDYSYEISKAKRLVDGV